MKITITGKNVSITPAMEDKIRRKLAGLSRYYLITPDDTARVLVRTYRPRGQKIEVTIRTRFAILRAEQVHDDLYAAIDLVVDKLADQIRRQKTRLQKHARRSLAENFIMERQDAEKEPDVPVRTKSIALETMSLDEAVMRMELLGHDFFIYTDDETRRPAVVYRRRESGYGLIETE